MINAFVALLLPLFRRWPGPALGYAWIHAFAWTLDLGCVPDVADSIAARFAGLEGEGRHLSVGSHPSPFYRS